jgi:hypothetical protein
VVGGIEKEQKEKKMNIDLRVSTKLQINASTNG